MLDKDQKPLIALSKDREIYIEPGMLNRHGLVTGATGTGKTVTLQSLAETFSHMGIPVFMADVKGDLSGIGAKGLLKGKVEERVTEFNLDRKGWRNRSCPVQFWDVFGKTGCPVRATVSDLGPILLARLLGLNDVQSGVLQIVFKIADDKGWLLLDLKDLRSMLNHALECREEYLARYGQISPASIGAIQRSLLKLESEGGELFFGEPALDISDLLRKENGEGVINILDAGMLVNTPALYSCLLLWLLSELFETLPEAGDLSQPRLIFFFDEAHLLFDSISPVLLQKIDQIVRLIRSRGVGIFFISQNPSDMPDSILGQLGNRVQHALRAFTPRDRKAVRAASQAFRPNPAFNTEDVIGELGVGEALVSFLDKKGAPEIVERAVIIPPESKIGPLSNEERQTLIKAGGLTEKYANAIDRESAYEILSARADSQNNEMQEIPKGKEAARQERETSRRAGHEPRETSSKPSSNSGKKAGADVLDDLLGSVLKQGARSAGSSIGRALGKGIMRGLLGGLMGKK